MWIRRNTLEAKLAKVMGYEYCTLFDTARSAMKHFPLTITIRGIPSNICPEIGEIFQRVTRVPVNPVTGLSERIGFHLYGYRSGSWGTLDIDPLMTGYLRPSGCDYSIISFGPGKMLDVGGGGALLSNYKFTEKGLRGKPPWYDKLSLWIDPHYPPFLDYIKDRRELIRKWDAALGDSCIRIPREQIMPWRVIRRIPERRDEVVKAIRAAGHPVGTNYPPLPGVTDEGAIRWGKEVINFFPDGDAKAISEIVKRTLAQ